MAVERLAASFKEETELVEKVFYRVPLTFFEKRGLSYAEPATLKELLLNLRGLDSFLSDTKGQMDLVSIFEKVDRDLKQSFKERRGLREEEKASFEWLSQFLFVLNQNLENPDTEVGLPLFEEFQIPQEDYPLLKTRGYLTSESQKIYFLFVKPTHTKNDFKFIKVFIQKIQKRIDEVKKDFPDMEVRLTGVPPIVYEEMVTTTRDVTKASMISFVGITLLFMLAFQAFRKPLMVATVMFMGIAYTFCFATLAVGSLNLMSMVFATMILGSGNDFGVHILMRYREERLKGHACKEAIETVVSQTGQGILSGGVATALVFYTLVFSGFKGFSEFGLISGTGVLICCVSMLIVVPAFLVLWEKSGRGQIYYEAKRVKERHKLTLPHVAKLLHYPRLTIAVSLILTALFFVAAKQVNFNGSLLDIQAKGSSSFANEMKMMEDSPLSPRFGAVLAQNLDEAKVKAEALKRLPVVSRVESIHSFLPEINPEKKVLLSQIKSKSDTLNLNWPKGGIHTDYFWKLQKRILKKLNLVEKYEGASAEEKRPLLNLKKELERIQKSGMELSREEATNRLQRFQNRMLESLEKGLVQLKELTKQQGVSLDELPQEIRDRFVGKNGELLIYVYPKKSVWGDEALIRFTEEIKRVDPEATGTPFLVREVTSLMERGYKRGGWLAMLAVTLLLFLDFRRLTPTLLALIPLLMGVVWMVGLMGILGMEFNPANLIAVPLILGIAIDNGVHLVHRFYERSAHCVDDIMKSTTKAVYLNSITTIVCFGSLMLASHRGIASLGLVLVLGVLTCLITAITFLPAVLTLISKK